MRAGNQEAVFAYVSKSREFGVLALEKWSGIGEEASLGVGKILIYEFGKLFEFRLENFVVVAAKSVASDLAFFVSWKVDLRLPLFFEVAPGLEIID